MNPVKAIRAKCIDCAGGSIPEVALCTATTCPLHPFRFGTNPSRRKRTLSQAHLEALRAGRKASEENPLQT